MLRTHSTSFLQTPLLVLHSRTLRRGSFFRHHRVTLRSRTAVISRSNENPQQDTPSFLRKIGEMSAMLLNPIDTAIQKMVLSKARADSSRRSRASVTSLLAELLEIEAEEVEAAVQQNMALLNEEFFNLTLTYLTLARNEGNNDMEARLQRVMRVCWDTKQNSLKPEIRFLNSLLAARDDMKQVKKLLATPDAAQLMMTNNRNFFTSLDKLTANVAQQQWNDERPLMLSQLAEIKREAVAELKRRVGQRGESSQPARPRGGDSPSQPQMAPSQWRDSPVTKSARISSDESARISNDEPPQPPPR